MIQDLTRRTESLIEALPYIQRFRQQTFVIKYGGSAMEDGERMEHFLREVVFLEAVGIHPVLVHGGGKAITSAMRKAGWKAQFVNGLRVTDEKSILIIEEVLDQDVKPRIVKAIEELGAKAIGFSGKKIFQAERIPSFRDPGGVAQDIGFVGEVSEVWTEDIRRAIQAQKIPVVSPIGCSGKNAVLNINADIAAAALASSLKASKLIFVSDVLGIMRDSARPESLISSINSLMIEELIEEKVISGGMIPKACSAVRALRNGVSQVHLISGAQEHSLLLEIFSQEGNGTEITL